MPFDGSIPGTVLAPTTALCAAAVGIITGIHCPFGPGTQVAMPTTVPFAGGNPHPIIGAAEPALAVVVVFGVVVFGDVEEGVDADGAGCLAFIAATIANIPPPPPPPPTAMGGGADAL